MGDIVGYIFGGLSIVTTITISIVTGVIKAANEKKKVIAEVAGERASLRFECTQMKETAEEIKELVRENYRVLAGTLETLQTTMLKSDELLGDRIGKVEVTVAGHTEAIGRLKDDVKEIKSYNGKKAG